MESDIRQHHFPGWKARLVSLWLGGGRDAEEGEREGEQSDEESEGEIEGGEGGEEHAEHEEREAFYK